MQLGGEKSGKLLVLLLVLHCGPTVAFSGALSSKSKADLLELAQALGVSLENARNNGDRCIHVDKNAHIQPAQQRQTENVPPLPDVESSMHPPATRRRLDAHWQPSSHHATDSEMNQPIAGPSHIPVMTHGTNDNNLLPPNDANHDVRGLNIPHFSYNHHFNMFPYHHAD
ncbi:uncharacterized protein EDB93DRAFT_1101553 [Suillus bovinus]|uniref:uncharacterized protein n=1 Tax=Suillus bovinus TaxID=48563 RepID=UPI001B881604|nr:uncharacterized protein EDB93DRAFT_1101553 [Suillus bovinus]KAG2156706.1 hypothetical protein EDB93DRAFT_1101553 [Suillus bovinus]